MAGMPDGPVNLVAALALGRAFVEENSLENEGCRNVTTVGDAERECTTPRAAEALRQVPAVRLTDPTGVYLVVVVFQIVRVLIHVG